ncbi:alcohol dehydrogenase, iron-containing family protein [Tritrichomonas foetus]|uniref:Alcohol dehydrogenase, iron-containing family protein n=1 Tax=Tritrichomonas foetus TaxID=1144522 RepID=A0A1J4KTC5_9EUKA|nr:alcohol dehydrogenase, iron-containing family protein [Tritrichomonas foetus]|eukprot:OHT13044.1 alcohol dehydrogenase, iron-containing family protein [Tritrichomonas foetus]
MKFFWQNTTQVCFGTGAVKDNLSKYVKPRSRVLCTFGGGSIDKNGARNDVQSALDALECEVRWEGGIPANPEYDRLIEIVASVKEFQPDLLLAIGGGSVIDGTKFISCAAKLDASADPWDVILIKKSFTGPTIPFGTVLTIPATGSEWNNGFVVSRRSMNWKSGCGFKQTYPVFSLLDPAYTMTLPVRQLRNGVFDAFCHCTDTVLTPQAPSMFDNFIFSVMKELVEIGPSVIKPDSSLELHERLIVAASFALNQIFSLGETGCYGVHKIGHMLTAKYGIDHGVTLAMVMPDLLKSQFEARKEKYAAAAEFVFNVRTGTVEEKAEALITNIEKFISDLEIPQKVGQWPGVKIGENDVEEVTKMVMQQSAIGGTFGYMGSFDEETTREILKKVIV